MSWIGRTWESGASAEGSAPRASAGRAKPALLAGALVFAAASLGYLGLVIHSTWFGGRASVEGAAYAGSRSSGLEAFNTEGLTVERRLIRSGGPGKDGIPSLTVGEHDEPPRVVGVGEAGFLEASARVVGVTVNGASRAYPMGVLNWHECVNDTLGGVPIAVIYCPLCDSATVVDRRVGERVLEFGVSGLLLNSNVLLYDRQTEGLWSQAKLEAISGPMAGRSLTHLDGWRITTFGEWRKRFGGSTVLGFETGHRRDYGRNPYGGYFTNERLMFPVEREDDRLPRKARVVGVRVGGRAIAYPLERIAAEGGRLVETFDEGKLVLEASGDDEAVVSEAPEGAETIHTFWFAWAAFHPKTEVYGAKKGQ